MKEATRKPASIFYLEDYDNAQSLLNPLVEKKNGEAMALMAKIYLEEGDTTHARNLWQELISSAGESQTAYNGLVLCDIQDGDYASALENVDKGLALSGEEARQELMYNAIVACERRRFRHRPDKSPGICGKIPRGRARHQGIHLPADEVSLWE